MSAAGRGVARQAAHEKHSPLTVCFHDKNVPLPSGIEISDWGIDTISYAFRPTSDTLWRHLEEPLETGCLLHGGEPGSHELEASSEVIRSALGGALVKEPIGGGRVGYFPRHRMLYWEGRLAALHAGNVKALGLAPPSKLVSGSYIAALEISTLLPETLFFQPSFVRRIDLAADVHFKGGGDGQGLRCLRALASIECPPLKTDARIKNGRVETVSYQTAKGIKMRIYDKGLESGRVKSGEAAPGEWLRVETQQRYIGSKQPAPADLAQAELGKMWEGRLRGWEASENVLVGDLGGMERVLVERVQEGRLSAQKAERLLGHLQLRGRGIGKEWWNAQGQPHLWGRRSKELRDLGLILDEDGLGTQKEVAELPLGQLLASLRRAWPSSTPE